MSDKERKPETELKLEENPFDPTRKRPEDVVRLFYQHNVPIIPVVSKRGLLLGIMKKEDVISELSDIERVEKLTIDSFITKLAAKMPLDSLLNYGKVKEFIVINIFGEIQGRWSRLQLFAAAESGEKGSGQKQEVESQREEQVLEWMIYLILEHIPRALYALNSRNKTIFYNSLFEEFYKKKHQKDVDTVFVEKLLRDPHKNQPVSGEKVGENNFFNADLGMLYEKIPLVSKQKRVGFLIFSLGEMDDTRTSSLSGIDIRGKSLADIMDTVERQILVDAIHKSKDLKVVAKELKIGVTQLKSRIKKHAIKA